MKKLLLSTLAAASIALAAGFGSASTDMDKTVDNPFIGGKSNFLIATASESGSYYKAGVKMSKQLTNAYSATTDGSGQNLDLLSQNLVNVAFVIVVFKSNITLSNTVSTVSAEKFTTFSLTSLFRK